MKSQWIFHILNSHLPPSLSSLFSPFKSLVHQNPTPKTSFVLNHADISRLLVICGREGYFFPLGSSLHGSITKNPEFFHRGNHDNQPHVFLIWNSLLSMYVKCRELRDAVKLFDDLPIRDTVSWNTMISGILRNGEFDAGIGLFKQMLRFDCCRLDQATLTTLLSACDKPELCFVTKMMHGLVFLSGYEQEVTVGNALVTSYFKCGCSSSGRQVFDEMFARNVVSWTAVISGLAQNQLYEDSLKLFMEMCRAPVAPNSFTYLSSLMACSGLEAIWEGRQIHSLVCKVGVVHDLCMESALMGMYSKCGSIKDAWQIFESAEEFDEVSITVMLVGLAQNGLEEEALHFLMTVIRAGIEIDMNMVSAILGVLGVDTCLGFGKQLHGLIVKKNFSSNPFVSNGLINVYSKCGDLEDSIKVFSRMFNRNSVSWNSMIAAFARHGDGLKGLQLYEEMIMEGAKPTDVTFLSLLHACSHVGLVEKGLNFLKSMTEVHGIRPRPEHYACIVDMLGRAGLLEEAKTFIEKSLGNPNVLVWQALLGACSIHGDPELGKYAAEKLFLAAPESAAPYILMANIYSSKGKWRERARTIKRMKEMGVGKETGMSWIEIEKKVHSFVVEDRMHPQGEIIYAVLAALFPLMVDEGYVPDKRFLLCYLDEENDSESQSCDFGSCTMRVG